MKYFFDDRRDIVIPGNYAETIKFCVEHFLGIAKKAIAERNCFAAALSGGSTPKAIFQALSQNKLCHEVDWSKVFLFWSDERAVPPDHPDSNYRMAMESGFFKLAIPETNIYRMQAESDGEKNAADYERIIREKLSKGCFDLVMLGMGEDGHTASLFPHTNALQETEKLVVMNYIPQKETWRMTFTFPCINSSRNIAIYVLGSSKAEMVHQVLSSQYDPNSLPIQKIGTSSHKALWILDSDASRLLKLFA